MTAETARAGQPTRLGRKRDHSRDPEILEAALDVLAEVGYEGMTVDMVATRAKAGKATLYRRWPSKAELVVDAVACLKRPEGEGAYVPPDTGTLRGDLVGMIKPKVVTDSTRHVRIMLGVVSMLSHEPDLREAINEIMLQPRLDAYRVVMQRAIDRGEIKAGPDIDLLASLGPAMMMFRVLYHERPPSKEGMLQLIDEVILPAVGLPAGGSAPVDGAHE